MKLFQITEVAEQQNHAGSKATADVAAVAERMGFRRLNIRMDTIVESVMGKAKRQVGYFRDWNQAEKEIEAGSVLLLQEPFHYKQLTREKTLRRIRNRGVKIISFVHDVEELRAYRYSDYYRQEFETMLELADVIIVHNDTMKEWFIGRGVAEEKLVSLEIFDYLHEDFGKKEVRFERSITVAGNLDTTKCGYIGQLGELGDVKVHLYGPNFNENLRECANIDYHGSFPADEIPRILDCGFGLVWDGSSIDGCQGKSGQYLRYNNPHKLSLYLSSGLPVVIWKDAAEAGFVEENGLGITVEKLTDLAEVFRTLDEKHWKELTANTESIARRLTAGAYAETALKEALKRLGC